MLHFVLYTFPRTRLPPAAFCCLAFIFVPACYRHYFSCLCELHLPAQHTTSSGRRRIALLRFALLATAVWRAAWGRAWATGRGQRTLCVTTSTSADVSSGLDVDVARMLSQRRIFSFLRL
jgi:hypothetical protein